MARVLNTSMFPILAKCGDDLAQITREGNVLISEIGNIIPGQGDINRESQVYRVAESHGFTKINVEEDVRFMPGHYGCVYISIFSVQHGELVPLCTALARKEDHSVVVTNQNTVVQVFDEMEFRRRTGLPATCNIIR